MPQAVRLCALEESMDPMWKEKNVWRKKMWWCTLLQRVYPATETLSFSSNYHSSLSWVILAGFFTANPGTIEDAIAAIDQFFSVIFEFCDVTYWPNQSLMINFSRADVSKIFEISQKLKFLLKCNNVPYKILTYNRSSKESICSRLGIRKRWCCT